MWRRVGALGAAVVMVGAVAACGGDGSSSASSATTSTARSSGNDGATSETTTTSVAPGSATNHWTRPLPAKVTVVDLVADSDGTTYDIDVWAGPVGSGSKLGTLRYATVGPALTPLDNDLSAPRNDVSTEDVYSYQLAFVPAGTSQVDPSGQQGEDAYEGDELVVVLTNGQPVGDRANYGDHVYFTAVGAGRAGGSSGVKTAFDGMTAARGDRLLLLDASGVLGGAEPGVSYDIGVAGQGCADEVGSADYSPPSGPNSRSTIGPGAFATFAYVVPASVTDVGVYLSPGGCDGTPVATISLSASAADRAIALLYGPTDALKSLVLPA